MPRRVTAITPAKINLGLEVLGRRSDGYHDIVTILQTISLYDRLIWQDTGAPFQYEPPSSIAPADDLVCRALSFGEDRDTWTGTLSLEKTVPIAAGLGGGSSDAALALKCAGLNQPDAVIHQEAATLGSDVPFFLTGGTALARGTGVELSPLPTPSCWAVLVSPDIAIPSKTRTLYQSLGPDDLTDGSNVEALARDIESRDAMEHPLPNAFSRALMEYAPLRAAGNALTSAGAPWASVSGAGPTMFTLVRAFVDAQAIARRIPPRFGRTFLARTIPATGYHAQAPVLAQLLRGKRVHR